MKNPLSLIASNFSDYKLFDSAECRKCEEISGFKVQRHSPQSIWAYKRHPKLWDNFDAVSIRKKDGGGQWEFKKNPPQNLKFKWLSESNTEYYFYIKFTSFGHCGLFFEQAPLWNLIEKMVKTQKLNNPSPKFLNLFAYTGAASMVAAKSGAQVTHIDSSKGILQWTKDNASLNNIEPSLLKIIHEDALTFVKNALKRNIKYDGILADPPSWGNGIKKNEVWNFDENFSELISSIKKILNPKNSFCILTSHTAHIQSACLHNVILENFNNFSTLHGDLGIKHHLDDRILPAGVYSICHDNLL